MTDLTPFNDDYDSNNSGNAEFVDIFNKNITRRDLITKTAGGAAFQVFLVKYVPIDNDVEEFIGSAANAAPILATKISARPFEVRVDGPKATVFLKSPVTYVIPVEEVVTPRALS